MIFNVDQINGIRSGRVTAALLPQSETPRIRHVDHIPVVVNPVRTVRREFIRRDGDGNPTGGRLVEPTTLKVTILTVQRRVWIHELELDVAKACGWKSVLELRADWKRRHPHMDLGTLVRFVAGADEARYLTSTSLMRWDEFGDSGTGDYTSSPSRAVDDAEALRQPEVDELAAHAGQKHARRQADMANRLAARSSADRLAEIERRRAAANR